MIRETVAVVFLCTASLCGQNVPPMAPPSDTWKPLQFLIGTWEAKTQGGTAGAASSGTYTFQLLAPIDQKTTKGSFNSVFLNSLFTAVSSTGQKQTIPTVELDVYNDYGSVQSKGNWALLHEGSLTWKDPNSVTLSNTDAVSAATGTSGSSTSAKSSTPYQAPTDPRTTYGYTTSTSAGLGVINSVNIFS